MTGEQLDGLRAFVLRFFLEEAKAPGQLIALPDVKHYDRRWMRRFVQALALAGLLDRWGATSGTWYRTSHTGYIVLVTLDEKLNTKVNRTRLPKLR